MRSGCRSPAPPRTWRCGTARSTTTSGTRGRSPPRRAGGRGTGAGSRERLPRLAGCHGGGRGRRRGGRAGDRGGSHRGQGPSRSGRSSPRCEPARRAPFYALDTVWDGYLRQYPADLIAVSRSLWRPSSASSRTWRRFIARLLAEAVEANGRHPFVLGSLGMQAQERGEADTAHGYAAEALALIRPGFVPAGHVTARALRGQRSCDRAAVDHRLHAQDQCGPAAATRRTCPGTPACSGAGRPGGGAAAAGGDGRSRGQRDGCSSNGASTSGGSRLAGVVDPDDDPSGGVIALGRCRGRGPASSSSSVGTRWGWRAAETWPGCARRRPLGRCARGGRCCPASPRLRRPAGGLAVHGVATLLTVLAHGGLEADRAPSARCSRTPCSQRWSGPGAPRGGPSADEAAGPPAVPRRRLRLVLSRCGGSSGHQRTVSARCPADPDQQRLAVVRLASADRLGPSRRQTACTACWPGR